MNLASKICLIIAAFFALSSIAWAGFNYESLNNYFMIDSVLKSGGDYIMVGNALNSSLVTEGPISTSNPTSKFLAVTNNLIFLNPEARFCTILNPNDDSCTGTRQIQKIGNAYVFKTKSVAINSGNDFGIYPKPGYANLSLEANNITIKSDLLLNQERNYGSLTLTQAIPPIQSIYAPIVSANEIKLFQGGSQYINISSGTVLKLISNIRPRYQRKITIKNNTGQALTDYQVAINNFPADLLAGDKMRADGWDLHFYADAALTPTQELDFFIDVMPKVWVKIPGAIPAYGTRDIYITYGGLVTDDPSNSAIFDDILGTATNSVDLAVSYNFDEVAGNTISESSLFGPSGILKDNTTTSPMHVSGRINNGIKTSGTQVISLTRSIPLYEWTIETWFKTPLNPPTNGYNILVRGSADMVIATRRYNNPFGFFLGTIENPGHNFDKTWFPCDTIPSTPAMDGLNLSNTTLFPPNTWHHLVAIGRNGKTEFYIDGTSAIGGKTCVAAYKSGNNVIHIGNYEDGKSSWGTFDEFRVYNTALSDSNINELAANCSFTTLALPGKVLVKKCPGNNRTIVEEEPTITWDSAETCNLYCNNEDLQSSLVTTAQAITYSVSSGGSTIKKNFCYVKKLDETTGKLNFANFTATTAPKSAGAEDDPADTCGGVVPGVGGASDVCKDTSASNTCARRACCQPGYYVFDFNASKNGKQEMVCCRYNDLAPCSLDSECAASGKKCIDGSCK